MTGALSTVRRHAVLIPVALIGADRAITLSYWQYESNPLVSGMGMAPWLGLSVACVLAMLYLWYGERMLQNGVAYVCVVLLSILMATVVVTNGLYVTGLWPF